MGRAKGEGPDPRVTVAIGGGIYRSTGRLGIVLPWRTRSERTYAVLLVDRAWMYTDPGDDDRACGLINEGVTVTWKLAYGRRYIRHFGPMAAEEGSQSFGGRWRASQPSPVDSCAPSPLASPQGQAPNPTYEC